MIFPLAICENPKISPRAQILYCRLMLFAGKNGVCNPSHETLAAKIGVCASQIRSLLSELRKYSLIDWRRTQTSCSYRIYPPEHFADPDCQETSVPIVSKPAVGVSVNQQQKEVLKEGLKDVLSADPDCLPTTRKKRESAKGGDSLMPSTPKQYSDLWALIARYMATDPKKPTAGDYPTARRVVEIMDAAGGASEQQVCKCLQHLYNERGLRPGTRNGPRNSKWFITVVREYFENWLVQEEVAQPSGFHAWEERNETKMAAMSSAFEPVESVA